jgi:hypothetical protein
LKGTRKRLLGAAGGIRGGREVVGWVERRRFVPLSHSLWIPS